MSVGERVSECRRESGCWRERVRERGSECGRERVSVAERE